MQKNIKLLICMLISTYIIVFSSVFANQAIINTNVLNVRENANTNSEILTRVNKNEKYDILETSSNWVKISKNNIIGWISKQYINVIEDAKEENTVKSIENTQEKVYKIVIASSLNVRELSSTTSNRIFVLNKNSKVEVLETKDGWDNIKYNDKTGWVSNLYLENISNVTETVKQEESKDEKVLKTVIINTGVLNVREKTSVTSKKIGSISYGVSVSVVSQEGEWYKIKYSNEYGYIMSKYTIERNTSTISRGDYVRTDSAVSLSASLAEKARGYVGCKYVYGGTSPKGFDCSGLVYYLYKDHVANLPRGAGSQSKTGELVEKQDLQKGDLIFFGNYGGKIVGHVGIYLEDGKFVHAANTKRGVVIDTVNSGYYYTNYLFAKRVID